MARLARTRAARNSSVSPARALRRPMRIFCPDGAGVISSPAARPSLIIGLVSGLCIHRAPRSNGTSKVEVSVSQRPPIWPAASTTITLRFAAMIRRAAAMPAAPAPITTMSASRGSGAAATRTAKRRHGRKGCATPTGSRGGSLSCHGFRRLEENGNILRTLPHLLRRSNHHGKSIMIDPFQRMNQIATAFDHDKEEKKRRDKAAWGDVSWA